MSDEIAESAENAEFAAIAERIQQGDDPYPVPEELLVDPDPLPPPGPVNKSLWAQILAMTVGQRIKLALKGNRDARMILVRDTNRLIQRFVLQNPRITDDEIVMIAKNRNLDAEILRIIGAHKTWPRKYQVRLALITNPKTPIATALHFLSSLMERDIRFLAKSKNVSATVVSQARRLLMLREAR